MAVLKNKTDQSDYKLVGAYLPPRVNNFVTLYTLANGISKSILIKKLIEDWMEGMKDAEKDFLYNISDRAIRQWNKRKEKHPRAGLNEFKTKLERELTHKGLTIKQIKTILESL